MSEAERRAESELQSQAAKSISTDLCHELYRLAAEHNGRDVELTLSGVPLLVIQDRDSAQYVLRRNSANYDKNMPWFRQALGPSRMTENGPQWRFRQMLSQTYLARFDRQRTFEQCVAAATHCAQALIAAGNGRADEGRADESRAAAIDDNQLREMAANVMLESFFGRSLKQSGIDIAEIAQLIAFGSDYAFSPQTDRPAFTPERLKAFLDVRAKVLEDLQSFRRDPGEPGSLLARLSQAESADGPQRSSQSQNGAAIGADADAGGGGDPFTLEHELTLFFAAGAETTAASMGWAFYLLARNPVIQRELHACVDAFWSRGAVQWTDLEAIAPLEAFLGEVLRIFPPTPVVGRRARTNDKIGGQPVAAGQQILVSLVGVQHQRPAPDQICEGASNEARANRTNLFDLRPLDLHQPADTAPNSGQSFSFGVGPRVCAGARFAMVEMMTFLATFLRLARFEPTSDAAPVFRWQSQLLHEGGQPVRLIAR